jgi:hypothetical protein
MNTTFSSPTEKALKNAKSYYKTSFTKEVYMNGFTPKNIKDHFGVSVLIVRGGEQILNDLTFTKKTGKLVMSETVERKYIY